MAVMILNAQVDRSPVPHRVESRLLRHEWQTARESNLPEATTVRNQDQFHQQAAKRPANVLFR
jgi:hypothetical protein